MGKRGGLSARKALKIDERSLRSLILRGYVSFDTRYGFRITDRGLERLRNWDDTDVYLEREKTHYGKFLQGLDDALSGSFKVREKLQAKTIVFPNGKRRRHAA